MVLFSVFIILNYVCVPACVCVHVHTCAQVFEDSRNNRSLRAGVPGGCELSDMGAGNQIHIFC